MYAAKIENNTVTQVIVGTPEWAAERLGGEWLGSETKVGVGWEVFEGAFRVPAPFPSWTWDGTTWQPPVAQPEEGEWIWDEESQAWVEFEFDGE